MKNYNYFDNDQSKLFSLFGRSRGSFHFDCLALINETCKESKGSVIKDSVIHEIEAEYGTEVNARLELSMLVESGWIESFQKPHMISDFIRMTQNGRILYDAICDIHDVKKDFSYGTLISDTYRRFITISDPSKSLYQDVILSSYEDINKLKEYMQNFSSSFEYYVKSRKANVKNANEIINLMKQVREGKEFRNYKTIIKDEWNYFRYSNGICEKIEFIKDNEELLAMIVHSCIFYEEINYEEASEKVLDMLFEIKMFFIEEYKELVEEMKYVENECYEKIANTLTLYANDGTAEKSVCDLIIKMIHDSQEGKAELDDPFFACFDLFDNNIFEPGSFKDKKKAAEYKKEETVEIKELSLADKLNILVVANSKIQMGSGLREIESYLDKNFKEKELIESKDFVINDEKDFTKVFSILINSTNPEFKYKLRKVNNDSVKKGKYQIPSFEIERR